ncbi:LysR family transcriptional regulator [Pandoraea terrae]|uniref:LysR family transcriptional regulator n=1 Tax=Pandoraea terrae TaxID=1537710 RepID=A0A5E4T4V1_9BURK|nr:LysR family transcriptional regulator [Pandoraea terrae]VVD81588.1 LysR family transcriptional regulator [Pandoraea terrae]
MNLASIDMNLLVAFDAIAKERNVTLAANAIGLSQPAMSNALSRLRKIFNDPLFVRTTRGMQPTPYAEQLSEPISRACDLISGALRIGTKFDPAASPRKVFTLYMTEIGEIVCMPRVLHHLNRIAPNITIKVCPIPEKGAQEAMAAGEVDLAIGIFPQLKAGFFQQRLYRDQFVCIARRGHPTIDGKLSHTQYVESPHVVVGSTGTGHDVALEQIRCSQQPHRKVVLTVPHFMVLPTIVTQTDAIATIPSRLATTPEMSPNLQILEPPVQFPDLEIRQHWHERYHHDAANKWLRELMVELFRE